MQLPKKFQLEIWKVVFIYFSSESLKAKAKGFPWLTNGKTEISHFENIYAKKSKLTAVINPGLVWWGLDGNFQQAERKCGARVNPNIKCLPNLQELVKQLHLPAVQCKPLA
jgi:hypothetical protein